MGKPANERAVRTGGLMRCCTRTIKQSTQDTEVGDTLQCSISCHSTMIVNDRGQWEWLREQEQVPEKG